MSGIVSPEGEGAATRASLPMYDLPGLQTIWDSWWRQICGRMAEAGIADLSPRLTRYPDLMAHWRDPAMRLSQTCGYPYKLGLERDWRLLATPSYDVEWCDGGRYRNLVLVRNTDAAKEMADLRGKRVAFNSEDSHSGYNSLRRMIAPLAENGTFFGAALRSGSHLNSIRAVAAGEADCCSVDCVTFALIVKHAVIPTDDVRVLAEGPLVPGLPFVVPRTTPDAVVDKLGAALLEAIAHPSLEPLNEALLVQGAVRFAEAEYDAISGMEAAAKQAGYPGLG